MLRQTTIGVFALYNQFIKLILPLPSFFTISLPTDDEPNGFPSAIHVLDRFHLVQFFTDAQQRCRRYLGEVKKHHKSRFIDRCLAQKPAELTAEERGWVCG